MDDIVRFAELSTKDAAEAREAVQNARAAVNDWLRREGEDDARRALDTEYWRIAQVILRHRAREAWDADESALKFTIHERLLLDYGLFDGRMLPVPDERTDEVLAAMQEDLERGPGPGPHRVFRTSEHLAIGYAKVAGTPVLQRLDAEIGELQTRKAEHEKVVSELRSLRDRALSAVSAPERLRTVLGHIEDILPLYAILSHKGGQPGALASEERRTLKRMEDALNSLRKEEGTLLEALKEGKRLRELNSRITLAILKIPRLDLELERARERRREAERKRRDIPFGTVFASVRGELDHLRQRCRRAGGSRIRYGAQLLIGRDPVVDREAVREIVARVVQADPILADAWASGDWKRPLLVILPGTGGALFEEDTRTVFTATAPPVADEHETSLIRALAHYRLFMDRDLRDSYGAMLGADRPRTASDLVERFTEGYLTWIKREAKGFRKLERREHDWFRREVFEAVGRRRE